MNVHIQGIDELFEKTKGNLFYMKGAGFLGSLLCRVTLQWTHEFDTAAITPKTLYWNPDFFLTLDKDTRVTVLAHELMHNMLMHGVRLKDRCHEIWNIAADHVVNLWLEEHGYYMDGFPYVMDPKYKGWSTEDVYDDLMKSGNRQPMPDPLGMDIRPVKSDEVLGATADVVTAKSIASMGKEAGTMPGEVSFVLDQFLNPKLPWETLLYNYFNQMTTDDFSYQRPNRRFDDPILPGRSGFNGLDHLLYCLDVSGSVTDEQVVTFNSELKFIKEELRPELLTLITFDDGIRDIFHFDRDEPFDKIVIIGRGGTNLREVYEYIEKHKPTAAVIFTDLEVCIPNDPGVPILWICCDNPEETVPYGTLIHIDTSA